MKMVELGRTGIKTSYLGFGTGTHGWNGGSDQTRMGHEKLVNLLKFANGRGIFLWDSAEGYGSHPHLSDALKDLDRSSVVIMTKTHSKSPDRVGESIPKFLEELGTDYLDILLMHCIGNANWLTEHAGVIEVLKSAKADGKVRAIGMSCHDFGALKTVASAEWIDVVLARINYDGTRMDAKPDEVVPVLEDIHNAGKAVIGMKIFGQGSLVTDLHKGMRFVMGLSCVDSIVIGMNSESHVRQNILLVDELSG